MMRHPAYGFWWRNVDIQFLDFDSDPRNKRFGLSKDGMNPFSEWGSSHSTWHVTLCMFNLLFLALHEEELYIDVGAYPRPQTTWQQY